MTPFSQEQQARQADAFLLSALQPLGYGSAYGNGYAYGKRILLRASKSDFLVRERISNYSFPTRITYRASGRAVVQDCYTAALYAKAKPLLAPRARMGGMTEFSARILVFHDIVIEFVYSGMIADLDPMFLRNRPPIFADLRPKLSPSPHGMENLLASAEKAARMVPRQAFIGSASGIDAGAAFGYAMYSSKDGRAKREDFHLSRWSTKDAPRHSKATSYASTLRPAGYGPQSLDLADHLSRLGIKAPLSSSLPPATESLRASSRVHTIASSTGSSKRSASALSRSYAPSSNVSHRLQWRKDSTSRASDTLVSSGYGSSTSEYEKLRTLNSLDIDSRSVAPSDSISQAGDLYSRRGMRRASDLAYSGRSKRMSFGGQSLGKIYESSREEYGHPSWRGTVGYS